MTANPPLIIRPVRKYFRTPKGILTALFAFTGLLAILAEGAGAVLPGLSMAIFAAVITDLALLKWETNKFEFPSGALLTGAIVGFLLSPFETMAVVLATSVIAIASKHVFRTRTANIFNPAAFGLVASAIIFQSVDSWWGAMPSLGFIGALVLLPIGIFIADRINKLPLVLAFLGTYFALFTGGALFGNSTMFAEIFRTPEIQAVLFFAFFMADDPPTAPVKYREQVIFAVIVAVSAFVFFQHFHWVYFLPAALLVGNVYEGGMKVIRSRRRKANQRTGAARRPVAAS